MSPAAVYKKPMRSARQQLALPSWWRALGVLCCSTLTVLAPACSDDTGPPVVTVDCRDAGCDDNNPCTEDICNADGSCGFEANHVGESCADNTVCNGAEACNAAGKCEAGVPIDVSDGDECTEDLCDPISGALTHEFIPDCNIIMPGWRPLSGVEAPSARRLHSSVWTGSEMIVWGGRTSDAFASNDGALYDPSTNLWRPMSEVDAPSARHSHSAVWTGDRMVVWGGFGLSDYATGGATYDPATDTWKAINNSNAPLPRTLHSTIWTGTHMLIWGGLNGAAPLLSGAQYSPQLNGWQSFDGTGALSARLNAAGIWTGETAIYWGGTDTVDWLDDGRPYNLAMGWQMPITEAGAPYTRESMSHLWTGEAMLIWGGWDGGNYLNDGSLYDPKTSSWQPMADTNAPGSRAGHTSLWTDDGSMFVWGGCTGQACTTVLGDGGVWHSQGGATPGEGVWSPVFEDPTFAPRIGHTAVWTGIEAIVFGGRDATDLVPGGARTTLEVDPQ